MVLLTLVLVGMGALFASAEVTMVAFCGQHGQRSLAGFPLAAFAGGSAISGLFYGAHTWRWPVLDRFRLQASVFAVLPVVFLVATNVPVVAACAFVVGLGTPRRSSPRSVWSGELVAPTSLTEGLAWIITGLNLGYGLGAALVGGIADAHGARVAFSVTIASGLAMGALALVLFRRLASREWRLTPPVATYPAPFGE